MIRRLSSFILIILFTAYAGGSSHADMLEVERGGMVPDSSLDLKIDYYAAIKPISNPGTNQSQDCYALDVFPFARSTEGPALSPVSDALGGGGGALFITGPITSVHNSVLDSSTMLLLGMSLIGISGYFGRKKFKR